MTPPNFHDDNTWKWHPAAGRELLVGNVVQTYHGEEGKITAIDDTGRVTIKLRYATLELSRTSFNATCLVGEQYKERQ